ncbi:MAG TPA: cytochrome c oxidase assembly protein [Chloroflexota bacterium]|nr:cytochrome c oxidase assembly protein [Chloroflexota bacterium]
MSDESMALLTSWNLEPELVAGLVVAIGLYFVGWMRLSRRTSEGRLLVRWWAWCYCSGMAAIAIALLSPVETFSGLFFFVHMIQHLLLMLVAAPLLWLGAPILPLMWALPRRVRVGLGRMFACGRPLHALLNFLTNPLVAQALFLATLAGWHVPPYYDIAQGRSLIHEFEHTMFLGTSLLFWWPVVHPWGGKRRLSYEAGIAYFIPPILVSNLIGALLTFAGRPLYTNYLHVPRLWGISVVLDQQLGGLIMWVPGMIPYAIAIFLLVSQLMKQGELREKEVEIAAAIQRKQLGTEPDEGAEEVDAL